MKTNDYPNWLVPLDIVEKLKEIGFDSDTEIFVDKSGSWYRGGEIFDYDNDGDFITYSVKEAYLNGDKDFMPTYSYEQVFKWFREKGFNSAIRSGYSEFYKNNESSKKPTLFYEYNIGNFAIGDVIFIVTYNNLCSSRDYFETYEEAREALVKKLIEIYKNENNTIRS